MKRRNMARRTRNGLGTRPQSSRRSYVVGCGHQPGPADVYAARIAGAQPQLQQLGLARPSIASRSVGSLGRRSRHPHLTHIHHQQSVYDGHFPGPRETYGS